MIIAVSAREKPMPRTSSEPVMAPVMIMGKPSQTSVTENALRRAFIGTGSCSYSLPEEMIDLLLGDVEAFRYGGRLGYTAVHCCNILP